MIINFTYDRQVIEFLKNTEHFVLVYPNTVTGRMAAKRAVLDWLLDCELNFDHHDAEAFRKVIDANRFHLTFNRLSERNVAWDRRRP